MNVEVVTDTRAFARLRPEWDRLLPRHGPTPLFSAFSWQYEWWRALGGGRRLRLLVARDGGEVRGILPLFEEEQDGARRLALVASAGGGSDFLGQTAGDERSRTSLLVAAEHLGADLLELDDLDGASPLAAAARELAREKGLPTELVARYPCPFIPVRVPFAEYAKTVARRENLRRREKWFAQQPGFRVSCETAPEAVAPFLARFHRLHDARWRGDGGSQAFADGRLLAFHDRIAARFADEGRLRLWTLWVSGEAAAVAYTFDDDEGRSLYYQSGLLPAWGGRSAGLVLFARYVEDAFARGVREVDLLRGSEPYKFEWTREGRVTVGVRWALTRRGRAALAWREARARAQAAVRTALPEPVRVRVARALREARRRSAA